MDCKRGALRMRSLDILPCLFLLTPEISQPKRAPAPPHRLLVVPSLFLASIHAVVDVHTGSCPNAGQEWALPSPILVWC